ncbi:hypothetical protein ACLKA6_002951 [Drosophila palustris]
MMEVTQKVDLKELPSEDEIMRSIAAELDEEVDKLNTPDIASSVGSRKSTVDEEMNNGLDSIDNNRDDEAVKPDLSKERDAGTDLDALLDKISSIVDCDPKETLDEENGENPSIVEATESEQPADDVNNKDECKPAIDNTEADSTDGKPAIDNTEAEVIDAVEEQKEAQIDNNVDAALDNSEEKIAEENTISEETESKQNIAEPENGDEADVDMVDSKDKNNGLQSVKNPENSNTEKTAATDESDKTKIPDLNASNDEEFLDALETISSSDEFDALPEAKTKTLDESTRKNDINNGLEDITSDDSNEEKNNDKMEKTEPTIIDLDSSDELPKETASEDSEKENIKEKDDSMELEQATEKKEDEEIKVTATQELKDDAIDEMLMEASDTYEASSKEAELETDGENPKGEEIDDIAKAEIEDLAKAESENPQQTEAPESTETVDKNIEKSPEPEKGKDAKLDSKEAESDDEVIFFEPIEKSAKKSETTTEADKDVPKSAEEAEATDKKDDEVVLVSEDEEEPPAPENRKPVEESSKKSEEEEKLDEKTESNLLADNSDNACDQYEKPKESQEKLKDNAVEDEDVDSNSSNLLQPSQKSRNETVTEAEQAEAEVEAEADGDVEGEADGEGEADTQLDQADVEMTVDEAEDEQDSGLPAVKRIRLSTEDKPEASSSSTTTTSVTTTTTEDEAQPTATKRRVSDSSLPDKDATPGKKLKIDDTDSNSSCDGNLQIDLDAQEHTEESESTPAELAKIKPKEPPIELKPAPELQDDVKPLRLDFVKSFRKSFDKMTRLDLEELVLQKVVEGMLVKSEFADIRRQLDKYETTLSNYRRKIAEVSKQFLDLETVHKRVLKDLETRNSHFTAPVRITRAVGLQVGMTLMKKPSDDPRNQSGLHTAGSMAAPAPSAAPSTSSSSSSVSSIQRPMQRSPMRGMPRASGGGMQHSPQQQQLQQLQQQQQARSSLPYVQTGGTPPPVRRGCMQKVTPQRPVNIMPSAHNQGSPGSAGMQRGGMQSSSPAGTSRVYATKHTSTHNNAAAVAAVAAAAAAAAMRSRGMTAKPMGAAYMAQKQQQQQQQLQQQKQQQQQQQQQQPMPVRIGRSPGKQPNNVNSNKARQMPTVSVPMTGASDSGAAAGGAGYGQPSLSPARPKEKAVIDLTDEDDAAAAAAAEAAARLRHNASVGVKRTMQQSSSGAAPGGAGNARPVAGSVVRVSPMSMQRSNAAARQNVTNNGAGQRNSMGGNVSMQIRSENTPPSLSRLRYSHPAPLPLAPAQTFHPDWKLPPSRPVIRISLHDSGIVISWTLEDTGSRFAECVMYQIYAYQETINEPTTDSWRHVGDVKAMLLPMAVTLNQFQENQRYFFAVRGVDAHDRYGVFSQPKTWE